MADFLTFMASLGTFALCNGLLFWSSFRLAVVIIPSHSKLDHLLAAMAIASAHVVGVVLLTAALSLLSLPITGSSSCLFSIAILVALRHSPRLYANLYINEFMAFVVRHKWIIATASSPAVAIAIAAIIHAAPRPPMGFDPINYHLTTIVHSIQTGGLSPFFFPPYFDLYSFLPANADLLSTWFILPFSSDTALPFVNLMPMALLVGSLYAILRDMGVPSTVSIPAISAISFVPFISQTLTETYSEVPLFAWVFAGLRFAVLTGKTRSLAIALITALLAGLVAGAKSNGPVLSAIIFLAVFVTFAGGLRDVGRTPRRLVAISAVMMSGVFLFGSAFYIRNYLFTGNPVFPYPVTLLGVEVFPGETGLSARLSNTNLNYVFGHVWQSGLLLKALVGDTFSPNAGWGLGVTGLVILIATPLTGTLYLGRTLVLRRLKPKIEPLLYFLVGLALLGFYFFTPYSGTFIFQNMRFAFPAIVLLGIALIGFSNELDVPSSWICSFFIFAGTASIAFTHVPSRLDVGIVAVFLATVVLFMGRVLLETVRHHRLISTIVGVALVIATAWIIHQQHVHKRVHAYRSATAPYQILLSSNADCLSAVDRIVPDGTLAIAVDARRKSFIYPLFGANLSRQITYVNITKDDARIAVAHPFGNPRHDPDHGSWKEKMRGVNPTGLLVLTDRANDDVPIEATWADGAPEEFINVYQSNDCTLYLPRFH